MPRILTVFHRPRPIKLFATVCTTLLLLACGGGGGGGGGGSPAPIITQMGGARQGAALNLAGTVTTLASFTNPFGMTTDGTNLYVADSTSHVIRKIVIATGATTVFAGTLGTFGTTDGTGTAAKFHSPADITTDGTNLYVADSGNHTIRQIAIATGAVTTIAGTAGMPGNGVVDGTGPAARFDTPSGITTDGTNLYVSDTLNRTIRQIVIATAVVTTIAGTGISPFHNPYGITTDGTRVYVADASNNTISQVVIATGVVTPLAGTFSSGSTDGTGLAAQFFYPYGITTDGTNLYVADTDNYTIRKIVIATGVVTTIAGTAGTIGTTNGTGTAATFNYPYGITTDGTRLFIGDSQGGTVRVMQ